MGFVWGNFSPIQKRKCEHYLYLLTFNFRFVSNSEKRKMDTTVF